MSYQYTHNNHFRFGYDSQLTFQKRQSPENNFQFEYGKIQAPLINWREANVLAAQKIVQNFSEPLWILFSGGMDSEVCIRSFLEADVPFSVATLRFKNDLNSHDLEYVEKLAKQFNLKVHYHDFDILQFWSSNEMLRIVESIACVSPLLAAHLWLAEKVQGVPVIAQGEPHLKKQISEDYIPGVSSYEPSPWHLVESERLCTLYQYFMFRSKPAVPGFFQYLPEQIYSFCFYNPILKNLVENQVIGKLGTRTSKNEMIHQYYPEMEKRTKYTGVEKIEAEHDKWRQFLAQRFPHSDANAYIEYDDLRIMLGGPNC